MDQETNVVEEAINQAKATAEEVETVEAEEVEEVEEVEVEEAEEVETVEVEETEGVETIEVEETEEADEVESGGFFSKKKDKKKKADAKDEKIAELTDRVARQMAEFDNFRKRTEKEKSAMYEMGAKDIVEKMLPVVDNFERGFQAVTDEERENPFVDGMDKIYKQLLTALEDMGVKPIPATGEEFNPDLHNAVMHIEDEELGENIVAEEFQKGYTYREHVVRHSMVKVAN